MAYGELGPTHHSIEDLAWTAGDRQPLRARARRSGADARRGALGGGRSPAPLYLRVPRFKVPDGHAGRRDRSSPAAPCASPTATTSRSSRSAPWCSRALDAAERLRAEGRRARVLNMPFVDPLDERGRARRRARDARHRHGRGGDRHRRPRRGGGEPRRPAPSRSRCGSSACRGFAPTGSTAFLLDHFGLNADGIAAAARSVSTMSSPDHVLAIDQGTQRDQGRAGRRGGRDRRARQRAGRPLDARGRAGSSRTRSEIWASVRAAVASASRRRRDRVAAVGFSTQRESLLLWDRRDRRAARADAELAGPAHRTARRAAPRHAERDPRAQRPAARPDVQRRQGALAAATRRRRASGVCLGTVDSFLLTPPRRRARDRGRQRGAHAAARRARARLGRRRCSTCSASRARRCRGSSRVDRPVPVRPRTSRRCRTARPCTR